MFAHRHVAWFYLRLSKRASQIDEALVNVEGKITAVNTLGIISGFSSELPGFILYLYCIHYNIYNIYHPCYHGVSSSPDRHNPAVPHLSRGPGTRMSLGITSKKPGKSALSACGWARVGCGYFKGAALDLYVLATLESYVLKLQVAAFLLMGRHAHQCNIDTNNQICMQHPFFIQNK